jgi:hypothetical protein
MTYISLKKEALHLNNVQTKYGNGSKCAILADCTFPYLFTHELYNRVDD